MPVPFAAVAADLLTGDEVVLDSGGLYDAIRASISIPSVFRPVHRDGRVLVDGGTVNPLPLNRVRREEGDLLVAVDVSARFGADSVRRANASLNYYKVLIASSQIMQQRITQLRHVRVLPFGGDSRGGACGDARGAGAAGNRR